MVLTADGYRAMAGALYTVTRREHPNVSRSLRLCLPLILLSLVLEVTLLNIEPVGAALFAGIILRGPLSSRNTDWTSLLPFACDSTLSQTLEIASIVQ